MDILDVEKWIHKGLHVPCCIYLANFVTLSCISPNIHAFQASHTWLHVYICIYMVIYARLYIY